ncbi:MAG: hypothetical protein JRJ68_04795 [Deltaproteobacteria bacterium]|nr:hypothetical protein [Deltaproteobacteria bacterium]
MRAHFSELNENITEQLLAGLSLNEEKTAHEAVLIGREGAGLASRALVPEEFKLLLVNRADMTKLMARIRLLSTGPSGTEKQLTIYRMLSNINNRIKRFDDGFWQYIQQRQQAAQNLLRGSLAMATVLLATLLFLLYVNFSRLNSEEENNLSKSPQKELPGRKFSLEELRLMSLCLLNELPPKRECHNIMSYANGIINCAQILKDQETSVDLQEEENQGLILDLWQDGRKIADAVLHIRAVQELYTVPVTSVDDTITLLINWLELQFPEATHIIELNRVESLPPVRIPGEDLFLAMALQAEQIIPEPAQDFGSCKFTRLLIQTDLQEEDEIVLEMILQSAAEEQSESDRDTATDIRQLISHDLLNHHGSSFQVSRKADQTIIYRFLLTP